MIAHLSGKLLVKTPPQLVIDVHGVGYEVEASMSTCCAIGEVGDEVSLHTYFVVREDAQLLYGFHQMAEKQAFCSLIKMSGVGPKLALAILSSLELAHFVQCVESGDSATLVKIPGVGKKMSERLVVEMRDRVKDWPVSATENSRPVMNAATQLHQMQQEAMSALVALGYKPQQASKALSTLDVSADKTVEGLIKQALKVLV